MPIVRVHKARHAISLALLALTLQGVVAASTCSAMAPICANAPFAFSAAVGTTSESGPDYDCLSDQPNPAWFYLEIETPGNLDILISMQDADGNGADVDFALWGPFASLSASQSACGPSLGAPISCSYSGDYVETAVVPSSAAGQFYVLLLTNYEGVPADITTVQSGGTGITSCRAAAVAAGLTTTSAPTSSPRAQTSAPFLVLTTSARKDPHLSLAHGGKADFRGVDGAVYNLLSAKNLSFNAQFSYSDFVMPHKCVTAQ